MSTNSEENIHSKPSTSKERRAIYMAQLRGALDSEYRHHERQNNACAMRKKRRENPLYREHERRQNRAHMAELRRANSEYRQREYIQNRHRMALKRSLISQTSSVNNDRTKPTSNEMINTIYQTLENNLQSSHISFIPYRSNFDSFLQQIDDYCRLQETGSSSDSNSRSTAST